MKNAGNICDKCMYNRLRLPGVFVHFEYSNCESASVMETLVNQISPKSTFMNRLGRFGCHLLIFRSRPLRTRRDASIECDPEVQSTLVISNSKGLYETLRDIRTSTYQVCGTEENN